MAVSTLTWSRAPLDSTELCYCFRAHSKPAPPTANGRRGTGFGFAANTSGRTHRPIVAFTGKREDLAQERCSRDLGRGSRACTRIRGRCLCARQGAARLGPQSVGLCRPARQACADVSGSGGQTGSTWRAVAEGAIAALRRAGASAFQAQFRAHAPSSLFVQLSLYSRRPAPVRARRIAINRRGMAGH